MNTSDGDRTWISYMIEWIDGPMNKTMLSGINPCGIDEKK